jgi:hypothetical protein
MELSIYFFPPLLSPCSVSSINFQLKLKADSITMKDTTVVTLDYDGSAVDEKKLGGPFIAEDAVDLLPDPDAHLSADQKASIVC